MRREWNPLESKIRRSEALAALPDDTCRAFYLFCLAQLDSYGRISASRAVLNAEVWPMLGKSAEETERCFEACAKVGLFEVYANGSKVWAQCPGWEEGPGPGPHPDRRGKSEFPPPSEDLLRTKSGPSPLARARTGQDPQDQTGGSGSRTSPPPAKLRKEPTGDHPALIRWFASEYERTRSQKYAVAPKDGVAAAGILKLGGLDEAKRKATALLDSTDKIHSKNPNLCYLLGAWNNLSERNGHAPGDLELFDAEAQRKRRQG